MGGLRRLAAGSALLAALASACASGPTTGPTNSSTSVPPSGPASPTGRTGSAPDPAPETSDAGSQPPAPRREPTVRLLVVGDIMLGRGVSRPGAPVRPLRYLADRIAGADLAVGNVESTLSAAGPPQQGDDSFVAPPGSLPGLARVGFDALSLANNHTGDYGTTALLQTVAAFRGSGVLGFGAGRSLADASRPAILTRRGVRFGFLGFNAIGETRHAGPGKPGALSVRMPPRTGPLDDGDLAVVTGAVRRLAARVDVVVVLPHWGTQYTHVAEPVQSQVGRALVRAGADLVVGGHPHWVQGVEVVGDAVVAHSLGNLVFDMDFMTQTMEGVTLTATFRGDRLARVALDPYRLTPDFAPRPVDGDAGAAIIADVCAHSPTVTEPARRAPVVPCAPAGLG